MGFVIDYIVKTSDKRVSSYDTLKRFIDEREQDTFVEFEDHKSDEVSIDMHDKYAEDHPLKDTFIEELKSFYVNLRDQIVNPNGSLYEFKTNSIP